MPRPTRRVIDGVHGVCAVLLLLATSVWAAEAEYPLGRGKLALVTGKQAAKSRFVFKARWQANGSTAMANPTFAGSTLRVAGTGEGDGDSGLIELAASGWRPLGKPPGSAGYRYEDPAAAAGGVRTILLKRGKRSGVLKVVGGGANWRYVADNPQESISLTFTLGDSRFCADFKSPKGQGRVVARSKSAPDSCPCASFDSTFAAIQSVVFEKRGCTEAACHGAAKQGGLDLTPGAAYANLVDVPASDPLAGMDRVKPGEQLSSYLWRKLAAKTIGLEDVPPPAMPDGGLPAIPAEELEAIRLWIRAGAPETGVVANTEQLLNSCLPPADPIKIRAPEPPAPGTGVQLYGPPWEILAGGEGEVCYATYYDISAQVPASATTPCPDYWGGPERTCFFYDKSELTQDPNSHHSIIHLYKNLKNYDIRTEEGNFGPWTCRGGANDGLACDPYGIGVPAPAGADCGADSGCAGRLYPSIACISLGPQGFGPEDYGFDLTGSGTSNAPAFSGSQQPVYVDEAPPEVSNTLPVKGTVVWNSHAFNITDQPTTNEQWLNLFFAPPEDQKYFVQGIFESQDIFVMSKKDPEAGTNGVPPFAKREFCRTYTLPRGARLFQFSSHTHKRGELFRIWGPGIAADCSSARGACDSEPGEPIFVTTEYNDPTVLVFNPPLEFDGADPASRRYKFCGRYDNGADNPEEVKRRSTSPRTPFGGLGPGGPCATEETACVAGPKKGQLCNGDDSFCDSTAGADDGSCDACPLKGGVTTEDEMFILLGRYYQVPVP